MRIYLSIFLAFLIVKNSKTLKEENVFNVANNLASKTGWDEKLKSIIEGFRETMKSGNKTLGLPRLDPFQSDPIDLPINTEDLFGKFFTSSVIIDGLSNFIVNQATFKIAGMKMNISVELPKIEGTVLNYTLSDGRLMNFVNVFGHGSAIFLIENVKFSIELSIAVNQTNKFLIIKNVKTSISIGGNKKTDIIQFYTEGLYNDLELSQLFSGVLSEFAPIAFDAYYEKMISTLNKVITDTVNKFLYGKTLKDLLPMIQKNET